MNDNGKATEANTPNFIKYPFTKIYCTEDLQGSGLDSWKNDSSCLPWTDMLSLKSNGIKQKTRSIQYSLKFSTDSSYVYF